MVFLLAGIIWVPVAEAQDTKVSINVTKQPLVKVLDELERQTEYTFFYNNDHIPKAAPVTVRIKDKPLSVVLQSILSERKLTYRLERNHIIISELPATTPSEEKQKQETSGIIVEGTVTDNSGEPLIGVSVISGTTGVVTDINGAYIIEVGPGAVLSFSCIGFNTIKQKAVAGRKLNVVMTEDIELLNEVVVIGYGTMDKKEVTSAVAHIGEKDFLKISSSDPAKLIQGKVAGVSIVNIGAADPNSTSSIQLRGVSSRQSGLGPLVVIDGVPHSSMNDVNPQDIASFDVLKDGAASAIYGTRGANGVILITTKHGSQDGVIHTSYSGAVSWDVKKELHMMTADEYRRYPAAWGDTGTDYGGDYDWLDGVSRTGFTHKHTFSLSGGNNRTNYRVSVDYRQAHGIDLKSKREEYGGRASIMHTTKDGLFTFTANLAPRVVSKVYAEWDVFRWALEANPTTPLMDPDDPTRYFNFDNQIIKYNPVERQLLNKAGVDEKVIDWDATAKLNLLPVLLKDPTHDLVLNTQVTLADYHYVSDTNSYIPSTSNDAINGGFEGEARRSSDFSRMKMLEWIGNFSGKFGDNSVKAVLGYSYNEWENSGHSAMNRDFANDGVTSDNIGSGSYATEEGIVGMDSYRNSSKLISFFGRVSYDWKSRYFITASLRREGSSKFGVNHKWGNFPAVSLGWRINEEPFMQGAADWLDELKLRGDYGETGNQDFSSYQSIPAMKGYGYYLIDGKFTQVWGTATNVNPDLGWEKSRNMNIGIDFSMFKGRFSGSLNFYNRKTTDLLGTYEVPMPPYTHANSTVNVGTMSNLGFEFNLNIVAVNMKDFNYNFDLVGVTNRNRFLSFSNSTYVGNKYYDVAGTEGPFEGFYLQRIEEGQPVGNFYMWKYAGINDKGEWMVYDRDGDIIEAWMADENDKQICGNGLPEFTFSTTHNFRYKNFDLSLFFRGAFGFDIFNIHDFYYGTRKFNGNMLTKAYSKNFDISPTSPHVATDYFLLVLAAKGMLTTEELDAFKGYMMYNSALQVPVTPQYDNTWVFRTLGKSMGACTRLFEITYDLTFLNRVIEYADAALYTRNGQPGGDFRIVGWTGEPNDVWPSTGADEEKIDGAVEQGAVLARIAYCARLILQTPSIWNQRVAANDRYYYGTTYKKRAETYLRMCDEIYDNWLTRFVHPGDLVFYRRNSTALIEPIAWNQALMACDGLTYMAQYHEILGNTSRAALYDGVVRGNLEFFIKDSWTVTSSAGTTCLQWRYSKVADKVKHAEDLNHASLVANVIYNIYLSGRHPYINEIMGQLANTMFDIVFCKKDDQGRFPGRINGAYEGKYMDNYVRDDHMQLADIRKDWYEKVLEINKGKLAGNLPMTGRALWCKTRRLPAPEDIIARFGMRGQEVNISWKSTASGSIRILHSADLWNWEEIASVDAPTNSYIDTGRDNTKAQYYRLVFLQGDDAGYSPLICVSE